MNDKQVKLLVDGQEIYAEEGTPLLQVAIDSNIEIPHFCYHPGIGIDGNCRLCLVEVVGQPKLATSCTTPVKSGMVVLTRSEPVKKARKGVLEFFLLNHPLDCPFCDKGGECPLQNFTLDSGQFTSRFKFEKLHKPKHQVIGEHIVLDKERCVLCNCCVRFGRNLAGKEELQIGERGSRAEIFIPQGTQLTSGFTGNLADICPVGALTTREFRFKARPWEMKTVNTVCGQCSLGCNTQAWKKENRLLRLTPRIAPDVNEWWLCDRGRFSIHLLSDDLRLKNISRAGKGVDGASPEKALALIAADLRRVQKHALAFIADPSLTNEEFFLLKSLAKGILGARLFVPVAMQARNAVEKVKTSRLEATFPRDLEQAKAVLILGERIEDDHPVLALRLRRLCSTKGLQMITAGNFIPDLKDVVTGHFSLDDSQIPSFFSALEGIAKGLDPQWENREDNHLWNILKESAPLFVFLSDRVFNSSVLMPMDRWLSASAARLEHRPSISFLLRGANARGMIDQWDDHVAPLASLETEIQNGKVHGLFWFGETHSSTVFDEYARGMRVFVQSVLQTKNAHRSTTWLLPLDLSTEKNGTYTNTFGRVQTLKRANRVVEKGCSTFEILSALQNEFGIGTAHFSEVYREVASTVGKGYPKTMSEIQEFTKTYHHYERALWQ